MNIKHLPLYFGVTLALGMVGVLSGTLPAQAQSGNFSDVTGTIVTTSDAAAGGFNPGGGAEVIISFRTRDIESAVNRAANSVNQQLAARNLPVVANGGPSTAIPATVQQNLGIVLTSSSNVDVNVTQIVNALVNAGASSTLARNLAFSLPGLTAGGTVKAAQFTTVIEAYNALITSSSYEFLIQPPEELRAIQVVLSILLNAAFTNS